MSTVSSRQKRKFETVDEGGLTAVTETVDEKPREATNHIDEHGLFLVDEYSRLCMSDTLRWAVTQPRRSKRETKKRRVQDISDEEDVSDYRPSPAKKLRKPAVPKARKPKSIDIRNVTSASPLPFAKQAKIENKDIVVTGESPILKETRTHLVVRGSHGFPLTSAA